MISLKIQINKSASPVSQPKSPSAKITVPLKARVLFEYKKSADDELTLNVNDIITILDKNLEDEGWWKGEVNGRIGVFPDNYVEEIPNSATPLLVCLEIGKKNSRFVIFFSQNSKHRPTTPESGKRTPSQSAPMNKLTNGGRLSVEFSNKTKTKCQFQIQQRMGIHMRIIIPNRTRLVMKKDMFHVIIRMLKSTISMQLRQQRNQRDLINQSLFQLNDHRRRQFENTFVFFKNKTKSSRQSFAFSGKWNQ